ncbi:MAG: hypothetical protein PF636_02360 [Actinomycetota bacterium]|nr:hypothetical protein [Actinomycetota bacterium]
MRIAFHPEIRSLRKYLIIVLAVVVGMVGLVICVEAPGAACEHLCCRGADLSRRARRLHLKLEAGVKALCFALLHLVLAARESLAMIAAPVSVPVFARVSSFRI